jgi:putative protease
MTQRCIELLSPAKDADIAIQAILHGADAVYIGATSHGARSSASNSIDEIRRVVDFAHQFRARVYVTVNTIVYDNELKSVESLVKELYKIGVDALIVQDFSLLRLDIPPIELHASTQCDNRTLEQIKFLQQTGFSQIVLARELSEKEITKICSEAEVPIECFVHGALCVSHSGRCHAGEVFAGRSANRGECPQVCRWVFDVKDASGKILAKGKNILSLRDLNLSDRVDRMLKAGVSSFKIEGRLKDISYVKNITAFYSGILNREIAKYPNKYCRSSYGISSVNFNPNPYKSFNRSFTHYFFDGITSEKRASIYTPKSLGEPINDFNCINNGDGISFFNKNGEYCGTRVNKVENGKLTTAGSIKIPSNTQIYRTFDLNREKILAGKTANRKINVDIKLYHNRVEAKDERGVKSIIYFNPTIAKARTIQDFKREFAKLGDTIYSLREFCSFIDTTVYIPPSQLSDARRRLVSALDRAAKASYRYSYRRVENTDAQYYKNKLSYRANISNRLAKDFYSLHGVKDIEPALELSKHHDGKIQIMSTHYCPLRELNLCLKQNNNGIKLPITLRSGNNNLILIPDCKRCGTDIYVIK